MPGIGIPELIIVLVILLVIFGPKRLPGLGRSLGSGMREFKDSISGHSKDDEEDGPRALERAAASTAVTEQRAADERVTEPRA
ncbi:MAG TPA: twin-arginine translocase TatA/TatE family subunit [Solirubrobacteraceae bacterium]|jgi:sec-independent protein translocase protein TatA|nr:twin-arginine translocase TatA/TatE family subunit [Solirubrobacteraceae bacterium]